MKNSISKNEIPIGVVGLGLMGTSVVTALLMSGHKVKAIAPLPGDMEVALQRIHGQLKHCSKACLLSEAPDWYLGQLTISEDYTNLTNCKVVLECVIEEISVKEMVYQKITDQVSSDTIIASNTSAIPISQLQKNILYPERFLGIPWAEPAYMTRFLEITCGSKTSAKYATWIFELAHHWGKVPKLHRKDIREFDKIRMMDAVYREMFSLVEKGDATIEDVDKAFRYDAGSWITLMGVFRRMDFMGLKDYHQIFQNIFPTLSNDDEVPTLMRQMVREKTRGTMDARGLYSYTQEEALEWDRAFALFNEDIFGLAALYPYKRRNEKDQFLGEHNSKFNNDEKV